MPTFTIWADHLEQVRAMPRGRFRDWVLSGWDRLPELVRAAHETGVTVLAGTDLPPCGRVGQATRRVDPRPDAPPST